MKKYNWITVLLLNIVTCGIYSLIMWYTMDANSKQMADKSGVTEEKNGWSFIVFFFLLSCVTCGITPLVWMYKHFKQQAAIAQKVGVALAPTDNPIVMVIIMCIPIYSFYVLCNNYNNLVDATGSAAE